jgi:competence protein ComK
MTKCLVDKETILVMGEYNQYGKLCSRVMTGKTTTLVDRSPLQLLDDTLTFIGFDLKGAVSSAKKILGMKVKCPVMVNPYQDTCFFPTKSPNKEDCIWFNPDHVIRMEPKGCLTEVELSNGYSIMVQAKFTSFNNKVQAAERLKKLSKERGLHPDTLLFYLEPKKSRLFTMKKTGKYNFDIMEQKENVHE